MSRHPVSRSSFTPTRRTVALGGTTALAAAALAACNPGGSGGVGPKPIPRGPVGPDDDEDFLRELERKRRHSKDKDDG